MPHPASQGYVLNPEQGYFSTVRASALPASNREDQPAKDCRQPRQIREYCSLYLKGEQWWLTDYESALAEQEQADRYESDLWQEVIVAELPGRDMVTSSNSCERWTYQSPQNHGMQMRIGKCSPMR